MKAFLRIPLRWVLFLGFLECFLRIGGAVSLSMQSYQNQTALKDKSAYRILCIGESTTFVGGKDSYPAQLERILNAGMAGRTFEVINRGLPGNNSAEIASRLNEDLDLYKPDMVVAMVGINDTGKTPVYSEKSKSVYLGDIRILRVAKFVWAHVNGKFNEWRQAFAQRSSGHPQTAVEKKLLEEIAIHPKNSGAYIELGQYYNEQKNYQRAADLFQRSIKANPKKDFGYKHLVVCLVKQGKVKEAEEVLTRALKKNAKRAWAYSLLSRFYEVQNRRKEAQDVLRKGLARMPGNIDLYIELISLFRERGDLPHADQALEAAIALEPDNPKLFKERGFNRAQGQQFFEAQQAFEEAARLAQPDTILDLSDWYLQHNDLKQAQAVLSHAVAVYPQDERLMRGVANLYAQAGQNDLAKEYQHKAEQLSGRHSLEATRLNYRTIVNIVQKHGAVMAAATYATRPLIPLKRMLSGLDGILWVDDGAVFQKILADGKYEDYFSDAFAGDFGHGTAKGNRVLAETIAQVILEELRKREPD